MQPIPSPQSDTNDLSQRLMMAAGLVATTGFALVSIAANLRFGVSLSITPFDRAIYGTLSVAADLMKIVLPLAVMILWRKGERIFALAGAVFWFGAVAFSLSAAIGFAASTRSHTVASNENLIESRKAWEAKIIRIEDRLDRLGTARPTNVIEAEIDGLLRTSGAEGCKAINGPVTREICPEVDRLRRELATSKETARLEGNLEADRQAFSAMPKTASVADPQSSTLSAITGIDEANIRSVIVVLIASLVELGSALGFMLLALASGDTKLGRQSLPLETEKASLPSLRLQPKTHGSVKHQVAKTPDDLVTRWTLDRLDIVSSGMTQADAAFQDFREWCSVNEHELLTRQMFGRRFTKVHAAIGGRKVRRGGCAYYMGAALQGQPQRQICSMENAPSQSPIQYAG